MLAAFLHLEKRFFAPLQPGTSIIHLESLNLNKIAPLLGPALEFRATGVRQLAKL
jgi:hypothetical protein